MQVHGATDLASKFQNGSDSSNLKPKEEIDDSFQLDMKVRCPCGSSLLTESMIKVISSSCIGLQWLFFPCFYPFKVSAYYKLEESSAPKYAQHKRKMGNLVC